MLDKFLHDIAIDGCIVQIGETEKIFTYDEKPNAQSLHLDYWSDHDLYFLGGVKPEKESERASNEDIKLKNYVYFDFDIRKKNPELTDEDIKFLVTTHYQPILAEVLPDWRYIVFTGNGIHVYFFSEKPFPVENKDLWKLGMKAKVRTLQEHFPDDLIDSSCINLARIARLPGSKNHKSNPPKDVEILVAQERFAGWLEGIEQAGKEEGERILAEQEKQLINWNVHKPDENSNYKRINQIPIAEIVCKVMGWILAGDRFRAPASNGKSACYISSNGNFLLHGGTSHLPADREAYYPFELVKTKKGFTNGQTFQWFREHYPQIFIEKNVEPLPKIEKEAGGFSDVLMRLQGLDFEPLRISPDLDKAKLMLRKCVTRIGALSYTGKSSVAYYLVHRLISNGYKGMIFSTEVPAEIVLANILKVEFRKRDVESVVEFVNANPAALENCMKILSRLSIFDVKDTRNSLTYVENIIQQKIAENPSDPPVFCMVDYCQMMTAKGRSDGSPFSSARQYAIESQEIAQRYNLAYLCLSQLNKSGINDLDEKHGVIPFENSSTLYAAADIAAMLKRDKSRGALDTRLSFDIRKHKYLNPPPEILYLQYDKCGSFHGVADYIKERIDFQDLPNVSQPELY